MNHVSMPGFTADRSLYASDGRYVGRGRAGARADAITPAIAATGLSAGRAGGLGGLGGGGTLNAWGCWSSCCGGHCAAGHYEAGPTGSQWVCDWYVCDDPCQRCIWPW